jgi:ribosomal protein S18 acetylase RimI-like enzyme
MIRSYKPGDLASLRQITITCFDGTSVDQNIEHLFGQLGDLDWEQKKALTINADTDANSEGIFVFECEGEVIAYITSRINRETVTGWIPNMAVLPGHRKEGIGKALMSAALDYLESEGMELVRIETLVQNEIGPTFYPNAGFQEIARQIHYAMPIKNRKI